MGSQKLHSAVQNVRRYVYGFFTIHDPTGIQLRLPMIGLGWISLTQ